MFEKHFMTTKCSISPLHFFFPFQEGDHSIIRMEEYIRNFGREHIKTTRGLYIRVPHPTVHQNHGQYQVVNKINYQN